MIELHKNINSDFKPNKNIKIKYEVSKPSYLLPSNVDKLMKHIGNKTTNFSRTDENTPLSINIKNSTNYKYNKKHDKKQNSMKKRIKEKNNKEKLISNNSIEKKRTINNNQLKNNHRSIQSPIAKTQMHKRINSLGITGKDNNNKNHYYKNYNKSNNINNSSSKNTTNTIDCSNKKQKLNNNTNNNYNSNGVDPTISSSNNISFSSENKKNSKNEKSNANGNTANTININNKNNSMRIDEIEKNNLYFSYNKNNNHDHDNNISNLEEYEQKQIKNNKNSDNNSSTLSAKIASRAKNLNKILEENFNTKKEKIEKSKEKEIKRDIKNELDEPNINNSKTSPKNDTFNSINNEKNTNNNHNMNNINYKLNNRQKQNKLSAELAIKKKKMQHKTASLNRSLDSRKKKIINENFNINIKNNNKNDTNDNNKINNSSNCKNKNPLKVFSKSDFREINTSPFVRSKPPIRPKPTNYITGKIKLKKHVGTKSMDKKYKSPQKEIDSVNGLISIDMQKKNNNYIKKSSLLSKKKKVNTKKKNKSMVIESKFEEKYDDKNDNNDDKHKNKNNINDKSDKNEEDNNNIDDNISNIEKEKEKEKENDIKNNINNSVNVISDENNNNNDNSDNNVEGPVSKNIRRPVRAQSQPEINTGGILDDISDILINKEEEESKATKKANKKILKLQSLCKKGFAGPGIKKTNQDNFFIYNNFNNNSNFIYMGVCDGHGMFGQDVSGYLVNTLPQNMNTNLLNSSISSLSTESSIKLFPIILSTFTSTNVEMTEDERVDSTYSGSTCVSLFYTPSKAICANVGDSRCVIGKFDGKNWKSKNLSRDQKPSEQDEYDRIINSGGRVESFKDENGNYIGPERVWLKDEDIPGLAMSRSFGDEIAHTVGVITEPEINEYYFVEEDKFIIIASDGLWEFISSDECIEMVKEYYIKNDIDGALNFLYKESSKRWIMEEEVIDDITILMAFLN